MSWFLLKMILLYLLKVKVSKTKMSLFSSSFVKRDVILWGRVGLDSFNRIVVPGLGEGGTGDNGLRPSHGHLCHTWQIWCAYKHVKIKENWNFLFFVLSLRFRKRKNQFFNNAHSLFIYLSYFYLSFLSYFFSLSLYIDISLSRPHYPFLSSLFFFVSHYLSISFFKISSFLSNSFVFTFSLLLFHSLFPLFLQLLFAELIFAK